MSDDERSARLRDILTTSKRDQLHRLLRHRSSYPFVPQPCILLHTSTQQNALL